jgi:hypothetical protein
MAISDSEYSDFIRSFQHYVGSHTVERMQAILESADLRRRLVANCPAAFNGDLSKSLNRLSRCLSDPER